MSPSTTSQEQVGTHLKTNEYYKFHTPIYDATRWLFLFGRRRLVGQLIHLVSRPDPIIADVGCGTGYMLNLFREYIADARLIGIDPSTEMLDKTRGKFKMDNQISLYNGTLPDVSNQLPATDVVLFSYSLTMMSDRHTVRQNLELASQTLRSGGLLGIVDFHSTTYNWFKKWMKLNHVRFDYDFQQMLSTLRLDTLVRLHPKAYLGWWRYTLYIGQKL